MMTRDRELETLLRAVLRDIPPMPDRVLSEALARLPAMPQRRTRWTTPRSARLPTRHRSLALVIVATTAAAVLAAALLVAGALRSSPAPAEADRAVVVRPAGSAVDVVLASADGSERLLRHLTPDDLGLGPDHTFQSGGHVSPGGWLEVYVDSSLTQDYHESRAAFVDLADPDRPPIVLPSNGFLGVRWGPDGQAALVCGPGPDCGQATDADGMSDVVRVLDLDTGSETIVHGVQLYGGNPEQIWVADGSGFLAGKAGHWGVTPLDGGPVVPGTPRILSHRFRLALAGGAVPALTDADTVGRQWLGDLLAPADPVAGTNAADGDAIWMLLDEVRGSQHQAVVAKLTGPGEITSVDRFDVPSPVVGLAMSADDTTVALDVGYEDPWPFVLARVDGYVSTTTTSPVIEGLRVGLVPAAETDGWPGG